MPEVVAILNVISGNTGDIAVFTTIFTTHDANWYEVPAVKPLMVCT